jgi:hypothetical protein
MAFTGKATYSAGSALPEIAEDVSDLVGIVAPYETPLLDALGDPLRAATSTRHEWLEDAMLPNTTTINQPGLDDSGLGTTVVTMADASCRAGDLIQVTTLREVMLVTQTNGNQVTVTRGYGGTTKQALAHGAAILILGNAALEGDVAGAPRFSTRVRKSNFTQIFSAALSVSGTEAAVRQVAVKDEMDYQKQLRLRELLRDLENTVINGVAPAATTEGSATVRRTMRGILRTIATNTFSPGVGGFPGDTQLVDDHVNVALRRVWEASGARPDLIVVGGYQKRRINSFVTSSQRFSTETEVFKRIVSTYESDYGTCRVLLSRFVPADAVLLLDSSRIGVLPLSGRSFHFKPLASTGDFDTGELIGEYTTEMRNESAHAVIRGLDIAP